MAMGRCSDAAWVAGLLVAVCAAVACGSTGQPDQLPDPTTLLRGVEAARLQVPPARLTVRAIYSDASQTNVQDFRVEFDGDRRRFVRLGPGAVTRAVYDGTQAFLFDGSYSITIRDASDPTSDYLFDPRLLGLTVSCAWGETIADSLPYRAASKIETIGRENIGGNAAWHVRLGNTNMYDLQVDVWIDEKAGFRVYRYDASTEGTRPSTALSSYADTGYQWLPTRVSCRRFDGKGQRMYERELEILSCEEKVRCPESTWTLSGITPPIGKPVEDRRIRTITGYWDGSRLAPHPGKQQAVAAHPRARPIVVTVFVLLAIAGLWAILRTRRTHA